MSRFEWTINIQLDGSRQTANKIQEAIYELIENYCQEPDNKLLDRVRGMSVDVSPVKGVKAVNAAR